MLLLLFWEFFPITVCCLIMLRFRSQHFHSSWSISTLLRLCNWEVLDILIIRLASASSIAMALSTQQPEEQTANTRRSGTSRNYSICKRVRATMISFNNLSNLKAPFTFLLSGRFEAQLLANVTLGIPMQSYMGLCMSLRHRPCNKNKKENKTK